MGNNQTTRQRTTDLLKALIAVVSGAIVFLPSILGALSPPHIMDGFLFGFWLFGALSLIFLGTTYYFVRFTTQTGIPFRLGSIGSWLALLGLVCLGIYVGVNIVQDRVSGPRITSIDVHPESLIAGETIRLSANVIDQDNDQINYLWLVNGQEISRSEIAYWTSPDKPGDYEIVLFADDGRLTRRSEYHVQLRLKAKGE